MLSRLSDLGTPGAGLSRPPPKPCRSSRRWSRGRRPLADRHQTAVQGETGLDPDALSGHSLRRGLVTSAALEGADINAIRSLTGHNDLNSLGKYMALVWAYENSPAQGLL